ncbi:translation initiation factor IF-2 [Fodinicurvata sediminis]|uniref:translation initiation factor IF-2 n=1 Tax=Fodinicurvata sediminis TaxID=1121832 RepID=UPI00047BEC42|nr:translation initiation factor IF-2 [Fodinicurvata sediminis]
MTTTDEKTDGKKPLTLNKNKKLELKKKIETGQVRQSFSHGRSKTVQVEVKRKRAYRPEDSTAEVASQQAAEKQRKEAAALQEQAAEVENDHNLTRAERDARLRAIEKAREEAERRAREEEEARKRAAEEEARRQAEEEEARKRAEEEEANRQAEAESQDETDGQETAEPAEGEADESAQASEADQASAQEAAEPAAAPPAEDKPAARKPAQREGEDSEARNKKRSAAKPAPSRGKGEQRRRQGKLTITRALDEDEEEERQRSLAAVRRRREKEKERSREQLQQGSKIIRDVVIPEAITVQELANRMAERGGEVVKTLMKLGVMATINQTIDADTAELVVTEFGHQAQRVSDEDIELGLAGGPDPEEALQPRSPVVTVMGHVDHGKTSLLDALRSTDIVAHEAGGITQHIGAYQIVVEGGSKITFIDTPGHAAFTEMRARGANVTDLVILVVAADDGIKDQTVEAINHAKAAGVPIVVAINKCDKPEADPERVKTELLQYELVPEDMGGDIICVEVSAISRDGINDLVESLLLQSELLELKANPDRSASGVVVEARLEQGRGSVATVLIQRGTLRVGDIFVTGSESGRVRALLNDRGEKVEQAGPSEPVEVLGLNGTPEAGDDFVVVEDDARAREVADFRGEKKRMTQLASATSGRGSLEQMMDRIKEGEAQTMPIVIKSDVHGSLEAITSALEKLATDEVKVQILHAGVGGINESDVTLARASGAPIIAFNVRANAQARELARRDGVEIRYYSIIYNVIDDVKALLSGMLSPEQRETFLGYAEIREVFNITRVGKVAGCMITEGQVKRGAKVRLLRDNVVIHDGTLKTLKRFKDEVKEVQQGYECGMAFENYNDIQVGDQIECYEIREIARSL